MFINRSGPAQLIFSFGLSIFIHAVSASNATAGGMTVGDLGPHAEGRGGAFTAKADDLSAVEYNPAALTGIGGTQFYLSNRFGYAAEDFKRQTTEDSLGDEISFSSVSNEHPWQLLNPMIAAGSNFGLKSWAFAAAVYAPPGIATQEFPEDGAQRYMLIKRDVKILYYSLSAAWKFKELFGFGASLQWVDAAQIKLSLVVDGSTGAMLHPDGNPLDYKATITGADHVGVSAVLGAWVKPLSFLHIALSGRIVPTSIDADCKIALDNVEGMFSNAALTRDGEPADDVTLSMKLPPMARLGVRYIHLSGQREVFDLELDVTYEAWSVMDKYVLDTHGLVATLGNNSVDVGKIKIDKNWKDTFSVRLGGDYNVLDKRLTLRAGTFFESGAKENDYAYVDFYGSHRLGGSLGASVMFFGFDVSLSYSFVYELSFSVDEEDSEVLQQVPARDTSIAAVANAGDYNAHYHFGSVSVSYTF